MMMMMMMMMMIVVVVVVAKLTVEMFRLLFPGAYLSGGHNSLQPQGNSHCYYYYY